MTATALIVDDEVDLCRLMQITLTKMGIKSDVAYDLTTAHQYLKDNQYDFCLTDMRLPDGSGLDLVKHISQQDWNMPVAVITAHGNMDIAIEALKLGAFDFVNKPLELPRLRQLVDNAIKVAQEAQNNAEKQIEKKSPAQQLLDERLIGDSPAMSKLKNTIIKLARSQAPVFLWGASGTGKEVVAKLIHELSPRREGSFVPVNCGAIPSELMESEFFGHKKGSFTGATTDKQGLFQQANRGTLFLDEVADLPLAMQVKLLRAIQEKTVRAIGDTKEVPVDIRILSATHKDLNHLVQLGKFRQDLFYRINVIELKLPTLNQRSQDIPMLAKHFLALIAKDWQLENDIRLSTDALVFLQTCEFEGNVRELRNLLERAVTLSEGEVIDVQQLEKNQPRTHQQPSSNSSSNTLSNSLTNAQDNPHTINPHTQPEITTHPRDSHHAHHRKVISGNDPIDTNTTDTPASSSMAKSTPATSYHTSGIHFVTSYRTNPLPPLGNTKSSSPEKHSHEDTSAHTNEAFHYLTAQLKENLDIETGIPINGLEDFLQKQEKAVIINALKQSRWNKTQAAKLLGMSLRSLRYRMDKLNVDSE